MCVSCRPSRSDTFFAKYVVFVVVWPGGGGALDLPSYSFGDFFVSLVLSCSTFFASFETLMPDDPPCIRAGSRGSLSPQKVKEEKIAKSEDPFRFLLLFLLLKVARILR